MPVNSPIASFYWTSNTRIQQALKTVSITKTLIEKCQEIENRNQSTRQWVVDDKQKYNTQNIKERIQYLTYIRIFSYFTIICVHKLSYLFSKLFSSRLS